jgi:hypothetical protein
MYLQMDPPDSPLRTSPIQTGWKNSIKPYPNRWFGYIDNLDSQFHAGWVPTRIWTQSDCPEPLLTLLSSKLSRHSQVHSQEKRHSPSHLTVCSNICSCMLDPETRRVADITRLEAWRMARSVWWATCGMCRVAGGRWRMLAEIMTSINMVV